MLNLNLDLDKEYSLRSNSGKDQMKFYTVDHYVKFIGGELSKREENSNKLVFSLEACKGAGYNCSHLCLNMKYKESVLKHFRDRNFTVISNVDKIIFKF
jgi:predicted adenine nucleotide alpha hydrolase (AANH) superfamily ATPase